MYHLLTTASIFLLVGDGNWCQAAGTPIYDLPALAKTTSSSTAKEKPTGQRNGKIVPGMRPYVLCGASVSLD